MSIFHHRPGNIAEIKGALQVNTKNEINMRLYCEKTVSGSKIKNILSSN